MKKKLLLPAIASACAAACALGFAACNSGDGNGNPYLISQTEWENQITSNVFSLTSSTETNFNDGDLVQLAYNGNAYMCWYEGVFDSPLYVKQKNANDYSYLKCEIVKGEGDKKEIETAITAEEYNGKVSAYIEFIDYVNENYSAFTFSDGKSTGQGVQGYSCDIAEMESKTTKVKDLDITDIAILNRTANGIGIEIEIIVDGNIKYYIGFKPSVLLFDNAFDTLTNYTLKGGVSTADADYAEYYFTENGFRMYTPNNDVPTRRELFYKYNSDTDDYTQYTKQADGTYATAQASKNAVQSVIASVHDTYMHFEKQQISFYKTADGMKNKSEITKTVGQRVFHFYDIDIKTDENGKITSATWKQHITQGEQSTQVYNMQLTAGSTDITFPS